MLAGAAAVPAVALAPALAAAAEPDPILAPIEKLRQVEALDFALACEIDQVEEGISTHRPAPLVALRDYSAISDFDAAREQFITHAVLTWKRSSGNTGRRSASIAQSCGQDESGTESMYWLRCAPASTSSMRAEFAAREALSKIRPTTIAAATALIEYLRADMKEVKNCEDSAVLASDASATPIRCRPN
jgi:hypothetical protein